MESNDAIAWPCGSQRTVEVQEARLDEHDDGAGDSVARETVGHDRI